VAVLSSSVLDTSAGTGARTINVMGLDANYVLQSEIVTLNGVTPVNTVNTFIRVHSASIQTAGSGGVNAGTITVRQTTTVKKDGVNKDLYLWLQAKESGKDKLVVSITVNETEAMCKAGMEFISEKYWAKQAGLPTEYRFDGSVKEGVENPLTEKIQNLYVGSGNFRILYHDLVLEEIKKIDSIIESEIIL